VVGWFWLHCSWFVGSKPACLQSAMIILGRPTPCFSNRQFIHTCCQTLFPWYCTREYTSFWLAKNAAYMHYCCCTCHVRQLQYLSCCRNLYNTVFNFGSGLVLAWQAGLQLCNKRYISV
jgi:hypothetical protein